MKRIILTKLGLLVGLLLAGTSGWGQTPTNFFVSLNGGDIYPYTNWAMAATNIQMAVDAAVTGATVWVSNGVYSTGTKVASGSSLSNRVSNTKAITIKSLNGPSKTFIKGDPTYPLRCVYMGAGTLDGFTLTNGGTLVSAALNNGAGGGVYAAVSSIITNCIITGNQAYDGGGACNGIYRNCIVSNNFAMDLGGGTAAQFGSASQFYGCKIVDNHCAGSGGGGVGGTYYNCVFTDNTALSGGGVYSANLQNCTVMNNRAFRYGGGLGGTNLAVNCIVYTNFAMIQGTENYSNAIFFSCCTVPLPPTGSGNITTAPLVVDPNNPRLLPGSPCIDAGTNSSWMTSNTDMEGYARILSGTVDIGAYEYAGAASLTGALGVAISVLTTQAVVGSSMPFTAAVSGQAQNLLWNFGDGATATNLWNPEHAWSAAGTYSVTLKVTNLSSSISATVKVAVVTITNYYVKPTGSDAAKGTNWATAMQTLQAAVKAAPIGATVWVTNGTYNSGGQSAGGQTLSNRVAVTWPLALRSVNGPGVTFIEGTNTLRGVYLSDGASLSGFTVRKGETQVNTSGNLTNRIRGVNLGGGVYCESHQPVITNCVIGQMDSTNKAYYGGGVYGGSLYDCNVLNNQATELGGGLAFAIAYDCTINSNRSVNTGGGVFDGTYVGCDLIGNSALTGGGAYNGVLSNCTFAANIATNNGGGASYAWLDHCTLTNNSVTAAALQAYGGGGAYKSTVLNCLVADNSAAASGGGIYEGNATNSIIRDNVAVSGGGLYHATPTSYYQACIIANNYATNGGGGYGVGGTYYQCIITNNRAEFQGGGVYKPAQLYTSLIANNWARFGAGLYNGALYRCTVIGNHGILQGGGAYQPSTIQNSIIYYNTAAFDENYAGPGGIPSYSCIDSPAVNLSLNNFTNPPGIISLDNPRLVRSAAGYNAGLNQGWMAGQLDLDGNPLVVNTTSDLGAYEYQGDSSSTGAITAGISATAGAAVAGSPIVFTARTTGTMDTLVWNFGDGTFLTNTPLARHAWSTPGNYTVALTVSNLTGIATSTTNVTIVSSAALYVAPTGNDAAAGDNWAVAKQTIQAAVDVAPIGAIIWVTNGAYSTGGRPAGNQNVTNVVAVTKPVTIQSVNGPAVTLIVGSGGPPPLTNQFGVRGLYLGEGASLVGFTVTNGQAGGWTNLNFTTYASGDLGGGIFCEAGSSLISNCVIVGNSAMNGGGVSGGTLVSSVLLGNTAWSTSLADTNRGNGGGTYYSQLYDCLVSSNIAYIQGAGTGYGLCVNSTSEWNTNVTSLTTNVYGGGGFMTAFTNCLIRFNQSHYGGGIAYGIADHCLILSNTASRSGGGTYYGILYTSTNGGNSAGYQGGGSYRSQMDKCLIQGNSSAEGGGSHSGSDVINYGLTNCVVTGNRATNTDGGGVYGYKIYNSLLKDNTAAMRGGGAINNSVFGSVIVGNTAGQQGGGYYALSGSSYSLVNCTLSSNVAGVEGGGVFWNGLTMFFTNCIIASNSATTGTNWSCNLASTKTNVYYSCTTPVPGTGIGCISADPLFINAAAGDYRLAADSPCIDAGTNVAYVMSATDFLSLPRTNNGTMDMGAYESAATLSVTTWPTAAVITYGQTLADSTLSGGAASVAGSFAFTTPGTFPEAGTALQSVSFTPTDMVTYGTVTGAVSVTVNKATAVVTLVGLSQTFDGTPKAVTAITVPTNLPMVCTYDGSTNAPTNAGSYTVIGTVSHNNYVGSATNTLDIAKAAQTITFAPIADQARTNTLTLNASVASGLAVAFAVVSGPGTLTSSSQLTFTDAGNVSVSASQAGDSNYLAAIPVTNTFAVTNIGNAVLALDTNALFYVITWNATNASATQTLVISNAGELALNLTNVMTYGEGASNWFTVSPDYGTLASGSSLVVTGAVTATNLMPGTYYATNAITSGEATNSPQVWVAQLTVNKAAQTITFPTLAEQVATNTLTLAATADSGLPVAYSVVSGPATLMDGTNLAFTGTGVVSMVVSQAGNSNYLAADSVTNTFNVIAAAQAPLVFAPATPQTYNTTNLLSVTGGSGTGAVSYTVLSGPGLLLEQDKLWVTNGTGAVELVATKAADALYNSLSVTSSVVAAKAEQTITFPPIADQARTNTVNLAATASSGLAVEFAVLSGPAQLVGSQLTFTAAGSATIAAAQAGDSNYLAAASVTNTFVVTNTGSAVLVLDTNAMTYAYTWNTTNLPPAQTLTVSNAGEQALTFTNIVTYGAGASNWLAVAPDNGALPAGNSLALTGAVTVTNLIPGTYYATNAITSVEATNSPQVWVAQLTVIKAAQTITFPTITEQETTNTVTLAATADSGLPVTFSMASGPASLFDGTNLIFTGMGVVSIVASQMGDSNYLAADSVTNNFNVVAAAQAPLVFAPVTPQTYNTTNLLTVTGGSGTGAVSYAVLSGPGQLLEAGKLWVTNGTGVVELVATKAADALYNSLSVTSAVVAAKASQTISFASIGVQIQTNIVALNATADSGLTVAFNVASGPAIISDGTTLTFTNRGVVSVAATQAGNENYASATALTNTFTVLGFYTLAISAPTNGAVPAAGLYSVLEGSIITNTAVWTNNVATTQYVCQGWTLSGHEPANGTTNYLELTLTNDAVLTWVCSTNYWLDVQAGFGGSVEVTNGWFASGSNVTLTAITKPHFSFTNWSGTVTSTANPLVLVMDGPAVVSANFAALVTVTNCTPHWWLADHGLTNNFELDAQGDADGDGVPNWAEFIAGSNPTNGSSVLRILSTETLQGTNYIEYIYTNRSSQVVTGRMYEAVGHVWRWQGTPGRYYDIEGTAQLSGGQWSGVSGATNLLGSDTIVWTNLYYGRTNHFEFFRIRARME
jgi:hypothetical protein